jgi:hypothetical protein
LKLIKTQNMNDHKIVTDSSPSPLSSPSRGEEAGRIEGFPYEGKKVIEEVG